MEPSGRYNFRVLLAGLILAIPITFVIISARFQALGGFSFAVEMSASAPAAMQLFPDSGRGYNELESVKAIGKASAAPVLYRFPLWPGRYRSFRFDPSASGGTFVISALHLDDNSGRTIATFPPARLKALSQIASLETHDDRAVAVVASGNIDPQLLLPLDSPIVLTVMTWQRWVEFIAIALAVALGSIVPVGWGWPRIRARLSRSFRSEGGPRRAERLLVFGAIGAALLSCYPVVFFGRSFVAPQFAGVPLVYETAPYLPGGSVTAPIENIHGSDVGAMPWADQPWSVVESNALLTDCEFPLWNRFNSSGIPLLGQGISMLGDPLQLLPILGGGAAWSWDLKFVVAKILFVVGNAFIVFHLTRSLPLGLLIGASSAFVGFFLYRINHPGFFTLCYSPWIFLPWLKMSVQRLGKTFGVWAVVLIIATIAVFASGAIKEAISVLLTLHLAGFACLLMARESVSGKLRKAIPLALVALAVIFLAYPMWASFIATLEGSQTLSDFALARVLPLRMLGAIFDDFLYYPISLQHFVTVNCFLGVGVVFACLSFRRFRHDRQYLGVLVGTLFAATFVYGLLPAPAIASIPFIGRMQNVFSTFSYPLVVLLVALAGYGYKAVFEMDAAAWRRTYRAAAVIVVLLFALTLVGNGADVATSLGLMPSGSVRSVAWWLLPLIVAALLLPQLLRWIVVQRGRDVAVIAMAALCLGVVHVRNGMQLESGFWLLDNVLLNPGPRPDYSVSSPALSVLPRDDREPYRVLGIGATLFQGYNGTLGLEGIGGPDPLVPSRYRDLTNALKLPLEWGWWFNLNAPAVVAHARALDFLNVRYVIGLAGSATLLPDLIARAQSDLDVMERASVWPRAFFVDRVTTYNDVAALAAMVANASAPFAAVEAVDRTSLPPALLASNSAAAAVPATGYRLTNNDTSFEIDAPRPGLVVLSEGYFPGVTVLVDGVEKPVLRVNHVFRGVVIDKAGVHAITFRFNPTYWQKAPLAFGIGLGCLTLAFAFSWWGGRRLAPARASS